VSLPAHKLTDKQIAELEHEDSFLRGAQALSILNEAVKETGVVIPPDYVFREMDVGVIKKAHDAVFGLLGGVPAMLLWAHANPTDFYKQYAKFANKDTTVVAAGTVNIVSNLPASTLDNRTIDAEGFVHAQTVDPDEDDV
jgi:hypothetical protein